MTKSLTTIEERNKFDGSLIYENNEFEDKTNRTKYLEKRANNDSSLWFIDKNEIKSEYREERECPICMNKEFELIFNKDGFDHVKCSSCQFFFVSSVLKDSVLMKHYENENEWVKVMLSDEEKRVNKIMYSQVLNFLDREKNIDSNLLLDIGSGSGYFLEVAKELSWDPFGIELNKDMLSLAKKNGLNVTNLSMKHYINEGKKFDVITSWYVLEHIKNMKNFIGEMKELIKDNGLLFIAVPQIDALVNRLYYKESPTFAGYSHINFFNKDSLNNFIEPLGFELVAQETHITQLKNIKKYFNRLGVSNNSGVKQFIENLTPEYIHNNFLGSNLVSVYRKIQ